MHDRAAFIISVFAAPIYKRRISSAYALHDFDSAITFCGRMLLYLSNMRQIQLQLSPHTIQKRTTMTAADNILH